MPTSLIPSEIELSAEVVQLAAKLGVSAYLPRVLEMTQSVFSEARLEVEAYQDHELAEEWWLVLVVRHAIDDPHELVNMTSAWHRELFDCCPAHLASAFSIDTSFRP